jgi:hypothetical protein
VRRYAHFAPEQLRKAADRLATLWYTALPKTSEAPEQVVIIGAGSRNRTHDQRFTKPLLYQLSYAGVAGL